MPDLWIKVETEKHSYPNERGKIRSLRHSI